MDLFCFSSFTKSGERVLIEDTSFTLGYRRTLQLLCYIVITQFDFISLIQLPEERLMHVYSDVFPIDSPCPFVHDIQVIVLVCLLNMSFYMTSPRAMYIYIQLNLYFALFFD